MAKGDPAVRGILHATYTFSYRAELFRRIDRLPSRKINPRDREAGSEAKSGMRRRASGRR